MPRKLLCTVRAQTEGAEGGIRPKHRGARGQPEGQVPRKLLCTVRAPTEGQQGEGSKGGNKGRRGACRAACYVTCTPRNPCPYRNMMAMDTEDRHGRVQVGHEKEG